MNKEILNRLASEAGFKVLYSSKYGSGIWSSLNEEKPIHDNLEKLIEMVVRECAGVADKNYFYLGSKGNIIKRHFGVK